MVPITDEIKGTVVPNTDQLEGTVVPSTEVNLVEGRNERSVEDAFNLKNEFVIFDEEVKDSIECEMVMGMKERTMPMGGRGTSPEGLQRKRIH